MPTPEHNPQSIPLSEIPAGYRFCRESERENLPEDARHFVCNGRWNSSSFCDKAVPTNTWLQNTYITATPLPESEREVPAASPWIPLSERVPSESDFPVFLYADAGLWSAFTQVRLCHYQPSMANLEFKDATHWQPAATRLPLPPAPAKTQREKDEAAFDKWWSGCRDFSARSGFHAALETERAHFGGRSSEEVAARINEISLYNNVGTGAGNALRALLSPPKEGETP